MRDENRKNEGVELLVDRYKKMFRIPENLNYYSDNDYKKAERAFIKVALNQGLAIS